MTATTTAFDTTLKNLGINRTGDIAGPVVKSKSQADTLTAKDFLKLLTAQLQNQDPTSPSDPTQQLSQLAQFSQVTATQEMNATLTSIADRLSGGSASDALAYVGRTVLTAGNTAYPRQDGTMTGAIELAGDTSNTRVSIEAPNGELLKVIDLGAQKKGTVEWNWDGKTANGAAAPAGPYKITVAANNNANLVSATGLVWAPVSSVSLPAGGAPKLSVEGIGDVAPSAVRKAS